ncbi:MAG: 6-pyruvoyl trahydropterin synthase family protein [Candidatus Hodarchaeales archaeon]|jgi:6-pyruvoyltetrahydropterin/6-carboxytetrahydropterin synthase
MKEITLHIEKFTLSFASAHFLIGFGKCDHLHGHNYNLRLRIKGEIGENHALIDFSSLKAKLRDLITPLDHKILIAGRSKSISVEEDARNNNIEITVGNKHYSFPKDDVFFLPLEATTCEQLSIYFHKKIKKEYPSFKIQVEIEETPGSSAICGIFE